MTTVRDWMNDTDIRQAVLTGAGLGLYFGWFFRPAREPNVAVVIGLSLLAALVTVVVRAVRGRRDGIVRVFGRTWLRFAAVLTVLEARHFAFDFGGRPAVIVMMLVVGALFGLWFALSDVNYD